MNTTRLPSPLIMVSDARTGAPAPAAPSARLARVTVPAGRSRTNNAVFPPPGASGDRFVALLANATRVPSELIVGDEEFPLAGVPSGARLTTLRAPVSTSATKTLLYRLS